MYFVCLCVCYFYYLDFQSDTACCATGAIFKIYIEYLCPFFLTDGIVNTSDLHGSILYIHSFSSCFNAVPRVLTQLHSLRGSVVSSPARFVQSIRSGDANPGLPSAAPPLLVGRLLAP